MTTLHLEITTPNGTVWSGEAESVTVPTRDGEITLLANHAALVGLVVPGALTVRVGNEEKYLAVSGGALEVLPGNRCVVLTDAAEPAENLVLEEIEAARARAQSALDASRNVDAVSFAAASAGVERELARLKVARKHRRDHHSTPES